MIIERNGKQIELTEEEMYAVHKEWQRKADKEMIFASLDWLVDIEDLEEEEADVLRDLVEEYLDEKKKKMETSYGIDEMLSNATEEFIRDYMVPDLEYIPEFQK